VSASAAVAIEVLIVRAAQERLLKNVNDGLLLENGCALAQELLQDQVRLADLRVIVCVYKRERECVCVCVYIRERECVCVCVCIRERESACVRM
jgi:hypothetical protein